MSDSMNQIIDVSYVETEVNIENKSTEQLTAEINVRYRQAESLAGMSLRMLADAGARLIEVKNRIPHGQFEDWCSENLEFSKSKAEKMMKLADRMADETSLFSKTETFTDIGISRVWALLAAPEEVATEVVESNDVESLTVRELKAEIARVKEEKEVADRKANTLEGNNDSMRKELASMQRKLSESVSEEEFAEMQAAAQAQKEDLTKELNEAKASVDEIQVKLDKAKEDIKKQKAKLKELEASKDEEVQKRLEEAGTELEEKIRADAQKEVEIALKEKADAIHALEMQVSALEAEKAKLSNTALMEFKVYADQLQDIYYKMNDIITEQNLKDEEVGAKLKAILQRIVEAWRP